MPPHDPNYPKWRPPVPRVEPLRTSTPPADFRASRPDSLGERYVWLEGKYEALLAQTRAQSKRLDVLEGIESESSIRDALLEAERTKAQEREKAKADAELATAIAQQNARRTFYYAILAGLIMSGVSSGITYFFLHR